MSEDAGVFDRPLGLMGIWGNIIYAWLDELLPLDVVSSVNDEVSEQLCCTSIKFFICCLAQTFTHCIHSFIFLLRHYPPLGKLEYLNFTVEKI
jgi:hypothetical protein